MGESNLLALASRIAEPYYIGFGTAATHYGITTQHRNVIWLVTPKHLRGRQIGETQVRVVNPVTRKFFGFVSIDYSDTKPSYPISKRQLLIVSIVLNLPEASEKQRTFWEPLVGDSIGKGDQLS